MRRRLMVATGTVAVLVVGGAGAAFALGGDEEGTATGPAADRATAAALAITGGGRANAVERDNEKGATWEVEITRPDGKTVDVRLDAAYRLVTVDGDTESENDSDGDRAE